MARRTPGRPRPAWGSFRTSGQQQHLSRVFALLVFSLRPATNTLVEGRSSRADVHEGDRGLVKNFWAGVSVGVTNVFGYSGCSACENALDFVFDTADDDAYDAYDDDGGGLAPTTVKIVGMGLGRTGSTSLAMAFDVLGYHPYHDDELNRVPMPAGSGDAEVERMWLDHFDRVGRAGFDVSFRTPLGVALQKGTKVILTVRDDAGEHKQPRAHTATAAHNEHRGGVLLRKHRHIRVARTCRHVRCAKGRLSDPATPAGSQHSCQPTVKLHILPLASMEFSSGGGVVRGRRVQQQAFA